MQGPLRVITPEQRQRARLNHKAALQRRAARQSRAGVYVLRLGDPGFYYVGQSSDVERRIEEHRRSSTLCSLKGGVCGRESLLMPREDNLLSWEQKETLAQMMRHGFNHVRGWEFTRGWEKLNYENLVTIKTTIFGMGDLCRSCGKGGHFLRSCPGGKAEWLQQLEQLIKDAQPERIATSIFQQLVHDSQAFDELQSEKSKQCKCCGCDISDRPSHHTVCYECWCNDWSEMDDNSSEIDDNSSEMNGASSEMDDSMSEVDDY